jgi:hypothetical protein
MADVTIRFRHNPSTGKRELVINYESDDDALPHEHERDHRALVEKVLGRALTEEDNLVIERVSKEKTKESERPEDAPAQRAPQANKGGG